MKITKLHRTLEFDQSPWMAPYIEMNTELRKQASSEFEKDFFKGCGMGPWLVLVSPCFRENVVATCKIGSFLCSLDLLLHKNVFVLCFGNQN